jgi:hypothetical protein
VFVDYDVDWQTPIFSFAGNVLNNFGIQLLLNTQLLPVLGLLQLFAHDEHILVAVVLFFIGMAPLFWAIGATWNSTSFACGFYGREHSIFYA